MQGWFSGHKLLWFLFVWEAFYLSLFWMTALLDKDFLAEYVSNSAHWIYPATPFWPAMFLWICLLQTWSVFSCRLGTFFPLLLHDSLLAYFVNLTMLCLVDGRFLLNLMGVLCASWILMSVSFPMLGKFSAMICSHNPSTPISLSSTSESHMILMLFLFNESLISNS